MDRKKKNYVYDAASIKVLKGLDAVKKRPGMYIGDTEDGSGLHHMIYEVVDNSVDEALAGYCDTIIISLNKDGSVSVKDNGRGIPVDFHKEEGMSAAKVIMTQLHAGGKFNQDSYKISGGLHGVGISVVNALSSKLILRIYRNKKEYSLDFHEGFTNKDLVITSSSSKARGTEIIFWPSVKIFLEINFDREVLLKKFRETAFLNSGLKIIFKDLRGEDPFEEQMCYQGGLRSFVEYLDKNNKSIIDQPLYYFEQKKNIYISFSLQWNSGYKTNILCFTNNIYQKEGGAHLSGLKAALTRCLSTHLSSYSKKKVELLGEDTREGLTCVLSVKVPDPKFSSQTKDKLVSSGVRPVVESFVTDKITEWLDENPSYAKTIREKLLQVISAREAASKVRELTRRKNALGFSELPGKLADCQISDPVKTEIFIVEGDSAGGSAKQGRDRGFQAVLPLKGKIINVEKANRVKVFSSDEIRVLITALGTGIGEDFDINKLRYNKVIIMTDADVDGSHIRTLLLTFFFRYMRELINKGHLYIVRPPLYKASRGKNITYLKDEKEKNIFLINRGVKGITLQYAETGALVGLRLIKFINSCNIFCRKIEECRLKIDKKTLEIFSLLGVSSIKDVSRDAEIVSRFNSLSLEGEKGWYINRDTDTLSVCRTVRGVGEKIIIPQSYLDSIVYHNLLSFALPLKKIFTGNVFLEKEGKKESYHLPSFLLTKIYSWGEVGVTLQRYKGLGEMNADQLWETTLDPQCRSISKVNIFDTIEADNLFEILMGDEVEPRKSFIKRNSLNVQNLDI